MSKNDDSGIEATISSIKDELKEIQVEYLALKERERPLRDKLRKLEIAAAIMRGEDEPHFEHAEGTTDTITGWNRKPGDLPSVWEMIVDVLQRHHEATGEGLTRLEILNAVREQYWPAAKSKNIGPVVWKAGDSGRLIKDGEKYLVPEKD